MGKEAPKEVWAAGDRYEPYIGRWSRLVAADFLGWLNIGEGKRWADVGCGTGALSQTILRTRRPESICAADRSEGFVRYAREHTRSEGSQVAFTVADAQALPFDGDRFDAVVSGLVLNFVPSADKMAGEMARVVRSGGTCALYVWDYAGKMELIRYFWDCAAELETGAASLDQGERFPICQPEPLKELFERSGLRSVETYPVMISTVFRDFDDYWNPFLGGQGPAPSYVASLSEDKRARLREAIRGRLPFEKDGSIRLVARAWAVKGTRP